MGINIVLIMACGLTAFLTASFLKARCYHGCSLISSILIALESPTCFIGISKRAVIFAWEKSKYEYGGEYPNLWSKISIVFYIMADWFSSIHLLHSLTITVMFELSVIKDMHTIDEVLNKKGIFVLTD